MKKIFAVVTALATMLTLVACSIVDDIKQELKQEILQELSQEVAVETASPESNLTATKLLSNFEEMLVPIEGQYWATKLSMVELDEGETCQPVVVSDFLGNKYDLRIYCAKSGKVSMVVLIRVSRIRLPTYSSSRHTSTPFGCARPQSVSV